MPGVLQAMDARYGQKTNFRDDDFLREEPEARLVFWSPTRQMDRIVAQQGTFTVALDILADHGSVIEEALAVPASDKRITHLKVVIAAGLKAEFMLQLKHMNLTASSLFPGADGLGRSIADVIRLGALSTR